MNKTFLIVAVLALGYICGVKFPGMATKVGLS